MALDDNPDEVFDNEPGTGGGNGDEHQNRTFLYLMIAMIAIGAVGILFIGIYLIGKQNSNAQVVAQQLMIQQTNEAVTALSLITPTPLPTDTPAPTNTAAPTNTPTPTPTPGKKDLVDTALAAGNFKTLASLLETANLVDMLKGQGSYTIFAPTDDAFAQVSSDSLDALKKDPKKLEAVLKYHVVEGAVKSSDMATLTETKTLEGASISIKVKDNTTTINDAKMTKPDVESSNGVIHPIDKVLVPPDMKGVIIVQAPPATTTASGAATAQPGKSTPASGSQATAVAQVKSTAQANAATKPASGSKATTVPSSAGTVTSSGGITNTKPISGTASQGKPGMPPTGAGEDLFLLFLAAICLMMVIFAARRLRTMSR